MSLANQASAVSLAPGKLILSGEHAVVYGAPALAIAVARHIRSQCSIRPDAAAGLSWSLPDLQQQGTLSWADVRAQLALLDSRHADFEAGTLSAAEILQSPQQLVLYCLALCLPEADPDCHLELSVCSQLPAGAGMGSSAAAAASVLSLISAHFGQPLAKQKLFERTRYCERLCHGRGGLIDSATVSFGGLVEVLNGVASPVPDAVLSGDWFYVNTGRPVSGTGECVEQVRQGFAGSDIWQAFTAVTEQIKTAVLHKQDARAAVRENQRLLETIGVVPARVAGFARAVEAAGGAAKISGAGAVRGDGGGAMLVYGISEPVLASLCAGFDYEFFAIEEDSDGARLSD
ncbi:mevalonate kinase family protein [Aliamphritea hakodatensis]|uniref:mevalonate kinase family protein n=1 Tax=Aliamphritea hakodatensis TaxID=2895352 RepID=UPI0022FD69F8|nr:mevalonate kinase [Aliamphritea hakodatensis]